MMSEPARASTAFAMAQLGMQGAAARRLHAVPRMRLALSTVFVLATFAASCGGAHKLGADGAAGAETAGTTGAAGTTADGAAGTSANATDAGSDANAVEDASPGATLPDFADGTRLKALAYVTEDGHKLWHAWRDTQRQETCTFRPDTAGKLRCLPASEWTVTFADDKCTTPILSRGACSGPVPAYASLGYPEACSTNGMPLHKLTVKVAAPAKLYYLGAGACMASTDFTKDGEFWQAAVTPEAPTSFVAAEEIRDGRGPALMARYYKAEDSALQLLGAYDRATQHKCAELANLHGVCAPDPVPSLSLEPVYADAACSVRTVLVSSLCASPTQVPDIVVTSYASDVCDGRSSAAKFYRVGAPYVDKPFLANGGMCAQSTSARVYPASPFRHLLGDVVPTSAFPAVQTVDEGEARLKVRTVETLDRQHLLASQLYDSETGSTCTPTLVGSTLRCLPDQGSVNTYFTDAACKQPVYATRVNCAPKFVTLPGQASCQGPGGTDPPRYFEVGAVVKPTKLYLGIGETCIEYPAPGELRALIEHPLTDAPAIAGE